MGELRENNETFANAETALAELATNARENLQQLVVDLRECLGGPVHDTVDEGLDHHPSGNGSSSSSSDHEIDAQRRSGGATTSSSVETGGNNTGVASFRRQ